MFKTIQRFVQTAYGDKLPTIEEWSLRHANKVTPDGIVNEFGALIPVKTAEA